MKTYIIGHKNPDTDSIVSAIALAEYYKSLGDETLAARDGELNNETKFVLNKFETEEPIMMTEKEKEVVLVDHNEPSQISEKVKIDEIKAIFDHHKLGGLSTTVPIFARILPFGSTATIIINFFREKNFDPSLETKKILLSGIISDTLNFTSPITTDEDRGTAQKLGKELIIDLDNLAREMFEAKSDITGIGVSDLIAADYKIFDMKNKKVGIGVWETVLPDGVLEKKGEILSELERKKENDELDLIYFAVVDIIKNSSSLFVISGDEDKIAKKAFAKDIISNIAELPGVVSRKKQIVPTIENAI